MCGRFALTTPADKIAEIFSVDVLPNVLPRYNIAPTTKVVALLEEAGIRQLTTLRWGLIPSWSKDKKIGYRLLNARGETVASKPSFRSAFKRRRCAILADGFYEWTRPDKKTRLPHLIVVDEGKPFCMAGLWEVWRDKDTGEEVRTCAIVTTGPNSLMEPIHNRMPVILQGSELDRWLDESMQDKEALSELIRPFDAERMQQRRVSQAVNNVKNKGPQCQLDPPEHELHA